MNASDSKCSLVVRLAAFGVLIFATATAQADFTLIGNFDNLVPGNVNGQDGWVAAGTSSQVTEDPEDPTNLVLEVTTDSTTAHKALLIPDETGRMLFFRFRFAQQLNCSLGMSDRTAPDQFHHFESEIGMSSATSELRIRDGNDYDILGTLVSDTWYNVWMLIDNSADTTQVYLHARPGEPATPADLQDADGQTIFTFRNDTAGDLLTYFIKTGGGNSPNSGPLYIDDIYVENTDALNLWNPTAEWPPAPANDDCAEALVIPSDAMAFTSSDISILAATTEAGELQEGCEVLDVGTSNSVWFAFVPTYCGTMSLSTEGSSYDTVMTVFEGTCADAAELACDDNGGIGMDALLEDVVIESGTSLLIKVADCDVEPETATGDLSLAVTVTPKWGDFDFDCIRTLQDHAQLCACLAGPGIPVIETGLSTCWIGDSEKDDDVDLYDFAAFQSSFQE